MELKKTAERPPGSRAAWLTATHLSQVTDLLVGHLYEHLNDEVDGLGRVAVDLRYKSQSRPSC